MMLIILDKLLLILYRNKKNYNNPKIKDEWRVEEEVEKAEKVEEEEKVKKVEEETEKAKVEEEKIYYILKNKF
jgi:hypothetical protein